MQKQLWNVFDLLCFFDSDKYVVSTWFFQCTGQKRSETKVATSALVRPYSPTESFIPQAQCFFRFMTRDSSDASARLASLHIPQQICVLQVPKNSRVICVTGVTPWFCFLKKPKTHLPPDQNRCRKPDLSAWLALPLPPRADSPGPGPCPQTSTGRWKPTGAFCTFSLTLITIIYGMKHLWMNQ